MKLIYNIHSQDLNDTLLLKSFDHQPNQYTKRECLFHFGDKTQSNTGDLNSKDILINQPELIYKTITVHRRDGYNAKKKLNNKIIENIKNSSIFDIKVSKNGEGRNKINSFLLPVSCLNGIFENGSFNIKDETNTKINLSPMHIMKNCHRGIDNKYYLVDEDYINPYILESSLISVINIHINIDGERLTFKANGAVENQNNKNIIVQFALEEALKVVRLLKNNIEIMQLYITAATEGNEQHHDGENVAIGVNQNNMLNQDNGQGYFDIQNDLHLKYKLFLSEFIGTVKNVSKEEAEQYAEIICLNEMSQLLRCFDIDLKPNINEITIFINEQLKTINIGNNIMGQGTDLNIQYKSFERHNIYLELCRDNVPLNIIIFILNENLDQFIEKAELMFANTERHTLHPSTIEALQKYNTNVTGKYFELSEDLRGIINNFILDELHKISKNIFKNTSNYSNMYHLLFDPKYQNINTNGYQKEDELMEHQPIIDSKITFDEEDRPELSLTYWVESMGDIIQDLELQYKDDKFYTKSKQIYDYRDELIKYKFFDTIDAEEQEKKLEKPLIKNDSPLFQHILANESAPQIHILELVHGLTSLLPFNILKKKNMIIEEKDIYLECIISEKHGE